eukprot:3558766-Amphidinium_carterae.2
MASQNVLAALHWSDSNLWLVHTIAWRKALKQYRHDVVENNMTLVEHYQSAPAKDGIVIEALRWLDGIFQQ